jgi:hypothetical protein
MCIISINRWQQRRVVAERGIVVVFVVAVC